MLPKAKYLLLPPLDKCLKDQSSLSSKRAANRALLWEPTEVDTSASATTVHARALERGTLGVVVLASALRNLRERSDYNLKPLAPRGVILQRDLTSSPALGWKSWGSSAEPLVNLLCPVKCDPSQTNRKRPDGRNSSKEVELPAPLF